MKIQSMLVSVLSLAVLQAEEAVPKNISVCYEMFSLPLSMAAKLHRERLADPELYERLVAAVNKETVRQETVTVLRCRSSQKATAESIGEQIYPTEYEPAGASGPPVVPVAPPPVKDGQPPVVTGSKAGSAEVTKAHGTNGPATPTSFDTRNAGVTLEFEATLSDDEKLVDLRLVPERVTMVGRTSYGQGVSATEMPAFETQRVNTAATVRINRPFLLGTMNRPPVSKADPDSANRVWFAFITATLAK
ncbi:hypothetical protein JIN84_05260 [Luteolibacter yonseiensis]|uniref:Uncharacterized protein n=1 Tax=Luteolibacter yonseiensis TaxID=1144680 RepID=A0A934R222_9BACT|nr:hypothetical protein [Luteolibacter yonseiensis]MBK1815012.1 hypothetical protein [Luteolibacter yonseiensis]